ncbi:MAG: DUF5916 domain-containing protein [Bacteroidota bacterium]
MPRSLLPATLAVLLLTPLAAQAQSVEAVFAADAPRIDGHLDDEVWRRIQPVTDFIQVWPEDGSASTERTEVRIAYDADYLYFAFHNFDGAPTLIRAKNLERGGRNDRDDHIYIGLDTYRDGRNAYLFEVNALGTQDDATITDEGLTIDSFSWDAVFRSETVIDETGWTMEVAIPFRQLRFPDGEDLAFGLMLSRTINRKNERVMWPRIGLEHAESSFGALSVVSRYGTLTGLRNVRRGRNLEIKPYVIAGVQETRPDLALEPTETDVQPDLGVDVKYGITSNLTLDASVNTDFAQVEADNVQVNLTRFNLFFPEKREFFLERSGLFEHGNSRSTQTFFSRRIGLDESILAGARVTGQVGPVSVGALNIETGPNLGDLFGSESSNNTVARVRADVLPRTTVGAIVTNLAQNRGETGAPDVQANTALGVDGLIRFGSNSEAEAWFTNVWDPDPTQAGSAGHASIRYETDRVASEVSYTGVGATYQPALGFVRRRDMRDAAGEVLLRFPIRSEPLSFLRRFSTGTSGRYITGQDGELQTRLVAGAARLEFSRRDVIGLEAAQTFERLTEPFPIRPDVVIAPGDYTFAQIALSGETDSSRPVYASGGVLAGQFFGGDRTDLRASAGWRQSQHLTVEGSVRHSIISLPVANGDFTATTLSSSVLAAINRDLFAKALFQYDNFSRDLQANIRINWIHTPGSDLFVVFNTAYHIGGADEVLFDPRRDIVLRDQVAVAKLTYLVLL